MSNSTSSLYQFGEFGLDAHRRVLRRGEAIVPLTPKAFDVLLLLIQNAGKTVSKDELMKAVWRDSFVEESNLTQTIFMVRKALEETSDRRYILTLQGQGYRFLVPVTEAGRSGPEPKPPEARATGESAAEVRLPSQTRPVMKWKPAFIALAALVLLLTTASALWFWRSQRRAAAPLGKIMLAVLPFENFTGDPGQEYFSDGLTEEMISQLGNLDPTHLGVIARTSVMRYKHTQESIPEIGRDLGVQYLVEGSVRRDAERVRITAQLIEVKDQSHLWAREYDRDLSRLLALQTEIAHEVANEIEFSLSGRRPIKAAEEAMGPAAEVSSYETYDLYLKGRYFWNQRTGEGFRRAADYFQQAIDKDRNYGRAYAGLADTFSLMSTWYIGPQNELMPKARTAALRALQLDQNLAEAHASLALIKENYDYDWPGAEEEFKRAIQLDPQYATAHQWYAEFLGWQGRFAEALAESEQARRLDPLSLIIAADHASILYDARQYEAAIKQLRSALELDPNNGHVRSLMIPVYLQLGQYDEALAGIDHWGADRNESPWAWASEAAVYGRSGRSAEARRAVAKVEQFPASPGRTAALLLAYSGVGQNEQMIGLLQRAYAEHSNAVVQIKVDPMYDGLRGDPRFDDLLRRVGLER